MEKKTTKTFKIDVILKFKKTTISILNQMATLVLWFTMFQSFQDCIDYLISTKFEQNLKIWYSEGIT